MLPYLRMKTNGRPIAGIVKVVAEDGGLLLYGLLLPLVLCLLQSLLANSQLLLHPTQVLLLLLELAVVLLPP